MITQKINEEYIACCRDSCMFWEESIGDPDCMLMKYLKVKTLNEIRTGIEAEGSAEWEQLWNNKKNPERFDYA